MTHPEVHAVPPGRRSPARGEPAASDIGVVAASINEHGVRLAGPPPTLDG